MKLKNPMQKILKNLKANILWIYIQHKIPLHNIKILMQIKILE